MSSQWQIIQYLGMQGTAGALVSIAQIAANKLSKRRAIQRKRALREHVIALNTFIASMRIASDQGEVAACLQDALRERSFTLGQLANLGNNDSRRSHRLALPSRARRLLLFYMPSRPVGWPLRWAFFTSLIMTCVGSIRGLRHTNYLPLPVLVPFLVATSSLTIVVRMAAFYAERDV